MAKIKILTGDALERLGELEIKSVQCVVTSPPYWGLRDYGIEGQLGLEKTPEEYVAKLVGIFREVRRVLRDDGTLWVNLGDSYWNQSPVRKSAAQAFEKKFTGGITGTRERRSGRGHDILKMKDLVGIPWRVAFAVQADGWYLRSDIIWSKPNPMPESVTDRPTRAHEYLFLITKSPCYYYDADAIRETQSKDSLAGRNKRTVWTIPTQPYPEAHFATFPTSLVEPCILAGSKVGDTVLDPFAGAGTVGLVASRLNRNFIGTELNPDYTAMAADRISKDAPLLNTVDLVQPKIERTTNR